MSEEMATASGGAVIKKHKISIFAAVMMVYCLVGGGYFGVEDMVSASGPGLTLLLLIVVPFIWSIPQALYACELGSAIPDEGGIYVWVKRAFGEFWAFQVGWWRNLACYLDSAVYVVLAAGYIDAFVPMEPVFSLILKIVIIAFFTWINLRGIEEVSKITTILMVFVLATVVLFVIFGAANWHYNPVTPFIPEGQTLTQSIGLGVAIALWLFSGYESMSTMSGEIENFSVITKATLLAVPIVIITYIIPVIFGLGSYGHYTEWAADGGVNFLTIVSSYGIPGLGLVFVLGAASSNLSLFNSYLASNSRSFYVMAEDHLAPKFLSRISKKHGTPITAILMMALVDLVLIQFQFDALLIIEVMVFMFYYAVWFFSGIALRIKEPDLERPFKIPGGTGGMIAITVLPVTLCVITMFTNGINSLFIGSLALLSGPIFYLIFKKMYGGTNNSKSLDVHQKKALGLLVGIIAFMIGAAGFMYAGQSTAATDAFATVEDTLSTNATFDAMSYDIVNDNFNAAMTDGKLGDADAKITYYQGSTAGDVSLSGVCADEEAFSKDAYQAYAQFLDEDGNLAVDSISIHNDDYTFDATSDDSYTSASDIYDYLTADSSAGASGE